MQRALMDLYLDLMTMSQVGFAAKSDINPVVWGHPVPPIAQPMNQAFHLVLYPVLVGAKYSQIRRES